MRETVIFSADEVEQVDVRNLDDFQPLIVRKFKYHMAVLAKKGMYLLLWASRRQKFQDSICH